jgi:gamma-glutamyl phosphate reductase
MKARNTLNRECGERQKLARLNHPVKRVPFRRAEEQRRQILDRSIPLAALTHCFSSYEVVPELVEAIAALLIRAFPNDLVNKRKEALGSRSKAKQRARSAKP